jgi:transketolase
MVEPNGKAGPRELVRMSTVMRRWIIEQSLASNAGHVASALSIADITAVLWGAVMRDPGTDVPDRDRFILSKGHAALALYAAMRYKGLLALEAFATFCRDGSTLGVHPERDLKGIDLSTGSLGMGLPVGCGMALGLKRRKSPARVFVLMSDAEMNEGAVWEAAQFAAHHRLDNLRAVVDLNGLQAFGYTRDVLDLSPVSVKWRAFGWEAVDVDGHDHDAVLSAVSASPDGKPRIVVARTVQGKGVSFMENRLEWHYRNLTPSQAKAALSEIGDGT